MTMFTLCLTTDHDLQQIAASIKNKGKTIWLLAKHVYAQLKRSILQFRSNTNTDNYAWLYMYV